MPVRRITVRRESFVGSLVKIALVAATLLTGLATQAFAAGSISGRVTSSVTSSGLQGTGVQFYDLLGNNDSFTAMVTTDSSGNYTVNLPPSTYAVVTQDIHGYINELYNNVPCSAVCDTNALTGVVVTNSAVTGIDFVLDPGGRITGKVTQADGTTPIAGVRVNFVDPNAQLIFTSAVSDALGNYISDGGTADGNVYAFTTNTFGYQDEIYNNIHCANCEITTGTAIAVTQASGASNINFALDLGGRITGTVRDGAGNPLANVGVNIYNSSGNRLSDFTLTDGSGNYSTPGFAAGNYFAATRNDIGLVDQLYSNLPCYGGQCNPTTGTAIPLTIGGTASGINFVLPVGGTISGTVTDFNGGAPLEHIFVGLFQVPTSGPQAGQTLFVGGRDTNALGAYSVVVPAGTYFAGVFNQGGFANQVYNGFSCVDGNCPINSGTPINVSTGAPTGNVNFALKAPGSITGTVTNAIGGTAINNVPVQVLSTAGVNAGTVFTNPSGVYTITGLAVGSYYVRTNQGGTGLINQLWSGVVCVNCNVTTSGGTLVPVTANTTTPNINFALATGGRISGTITNAVGGAAIQGVSAQLFTSTGVSMGNFNSAASGVYTTSGLPAGNYYVRTGVSATQNFIDLLWKSPTNLPCVPCAVTTGTQIAVAGTGTVGGINFALSAGGSITGTVTDAGTAAAVTIGLIVYDSTGVIVKTVTSDASGNYTVVGLPTGNYFIRTNPNVSTQNYVTQLYNAISYGGLPTIGTPVSVTAGGVHGGVNFALVSGGSLSGTVTASDTGLPIAQTQIAVYSPSGKVVKMSATDNSGNVTITGLAAGTYYVSTSAPSNVTPFYVDELYDDVRPCFGCVTISGSALPIVTLPCAACQAVTTGTPIVITNGTTRTGVNFVLFPGAGVISGAVTSAATGVGLVNVQVSVYTGAGQLVKSVTTAQNTGGYIVRGLVPGTYYLRTVVSPATPFYTDQAYGGAACAPCDVPATSGAILVSANSTSTANFPLSAGGAITGTVTDAATTNPLSPVDVQLYNSVGALVKTTFTGSTGGFTLDGLPAGNYYARTAVPASLSIYVDELYDNIPCVSCTVTTGTAIVVTNGTTRSGVDFGLLPKAPTVVTTAGSVIGAQATLNGTVNPNGSSTTALFQFGPTTSYGQTVAASPAPGSGTSPVAISGTVQPLSCGSTYHFRAVATNVGGTTNGGDQTVTTGACPPVITFVSPNSGQQGQANLNVVITGGFTHFVQGTSTANLGAGITVNSTTVQSATQATANVTIALSATLGARTVTVTTGGEVVSLASGFTVTASAPTLTGVSPSAGRRGSTNLNVSLTAQATHFVQGTTAAAFGAGVTVNSTTVQSATQATANLTIAAAAALGPRTVTVTTGGEVVALSSAFVVTPVTTSPGDFDGDGKSDTTIFRPSNGTWYSINSSTGTPTAVTWGNGADKLVAGDYDGDGRTDAAIFRPSDGGWYVVNSGTGVPTGFIWGNGSDIAVPGDYDGDKKTDIAIFRPSNGSWFVVRSSTGVPFGFVWGGGADIPVPADYDGDGKTDIAIFRPSSGAWFVVPSTTGVPYGFVWGGGADKPVPADYDGDGKADIAIFRPSDGGWYIVRSSTGIPVGIIWGNGADTPVPGDFDGDGKTDIAVFRPSNGTWFVVPSTTGVPFGVAWGNSSDIPILKRP